MFLYLGFYLAHDVRIVQQELLSVVTSLTKLHIVVAEPSSALLNDIKVSRHVKHLANTGDTLAVHDIELALLERRCYLILYHLALCSVANDLRAVLYLLSTSYLYSYRSVELQSTSAWSSFRVSVHNTYLLTDLIDKYSRCIGLCDNRCELSHSLRHKSCKLTNVSVAHFAVYLRFCYHCRNRVDNDTVDSTGTSQSLGYLQSLLTTVRLRNKHIVDINAKLTCINRVKSVLNVDKSYLSAHFLRFCDNMKCDRCLT